MRNCLMQILQESRQEEPVKDASYANEVGTAQRDHELMKLKAGMKAALAHIKDLEAFTDEMYVPLRSCAANGDFLVSFA